ncbi:mechanosensitive ion channel family protein [bacterium]|nr:mechanosensitive ion channel family protein [bacterium]MBU1653163.1 mechanosensitive ion channel family protein [bacterium]
MILKEFGTWVATSGVRVVIIIILALVGIKSVSIISSRLGGLLTKQRVDEEDKKRADTLSSVVRHLLNVVVFLVAFMMLLDQFGVEIGPILAAAGIVGLAVGFGAQNLVKDVINGFFILLEDQIRIGDWIDIAGKSGLVERVNLKMTILRDMAGNVHYIPNGNIEVVTNMTKEFSHYVFEIGVAYREDTDEVVEVMKQVDEEIRNDDAFKSDIIAPLEILGVDKFADSAVIIKARTKTKPIKQWRIGREYNRRLKKAFDAKGIEIPFPHRTVYFGVGKDGTAEPLRLKNEESGNGNSD